MATVFGNDFDGLDGDRGNRYVFVITLVAGLNAGNLVHDVHALRHLAENGIAPAARVGAGAVVEEIIVLQVDEELDAGGMRILRARHGNGAAVVGEAVGRFVLQRRGARLLFFHRRIEAAALDHEIVDDAVENGALIEAVLGVVQEHLDRLWRLLRVEFDGHLAQIGGHFDRRGGPAGEGDQQAGEQDRGFLQHQALPS